MRASEDVLYFTPHVDVYSRNECNGEKKSLESKLGVAYSRYSSDVTERNECNGAIEPPPSKVL